jgi:hypothetical protein
MAVRTTAPRDRGPNSVIAITRRMCWIRTSTAWRSTLNHGCTTVPIPLEFHRWLRTFPKGPFGCLVVVTTRCRPWSRNGTWSTARDAGRGRSPFGGGARTPTSRRRALNGDTGPSWSRKGGKVVMIPLAPRTARRSASAPKARSSLTAAGCTGMVPGGSSAGSPGGPKSTSASARTGCDTTAALDPGVPLRDVQEAASHADPRTTMGYDRARASLDPHAT